MIVLYCDFVFLYLVDKKKLDRISVYHVFAILGTGIAFDRSDYFRAFKLINLIHALGKVPKK